MIWSDGFTSTYYITLVDPLTWRDTGRMEIVSGSVERSDDILKESADLDMTELPEGGERWIRIWLDADQQGVVHVPLFTGLTSAPSRSIDGLRESFSIECHSVLKPIDDILTERGYYIPADVPAPQAAARLLRKGPAPVTILQAENAPRLEEAIVAEDSETNLTLALKVLESVNWRIRIDGMGTITIEERADNISAVFDANKNDIVELALTDESDWYSCPNVLRAISGDLTATARDDDPLSALSTVTRGREIWAEESSVSLGSNESLAAYAIRRLKELQSPSRTISYARRFDPDVTVGDLVGINHPEIGVDGTFRVVSQTLELGPGCRTQEDAVLEEAK